MDECLYYYPLWETTLGGDCITLMCFASVLFAWYSIFSQSCILHYDGKTASTKNATTIFWLWDKKDQIQSCWKEFAICVSIMSVKILEKANAWQVWTLTPAMQPLDRHCRTESNTSFSTPPCKHIWGPLGSIPQQGEQVFLPLHPFPSVTGLPRRVVTSVRHAVGGWVCAEVSNCFATAQTHAPPLLPPPWGPTGWKVKKLPSLLSTLWAVWKNLFPTTCFILVKHLHPLVIVNLSHIFLLKME